MYSVSQCRSYKSPVYKKQGFEIFFFKKKKKQREEKNYIAIWDLLYTLYTLYTNHKKKENKKKMTLNMLTNEPKSNLLFFLSQCIVKCIVIYYTLLVFLRPRFFPKNACLGTLIH